MGYSTSGADAATVTSNSFGTWIGGGRNGSARDREAIITGANAHTAIVKIRLRGISIMESTLTPTEKKKADCLAHVISCAGWLL